MKIKLISIFLILIFLCLNLSARYYDPDIGRFTTADTATPRGGTDSQGLNRYSYCLNNPVKYVDPTGQAPIGSGMFEVAMPDVTAYLGGHEPYPIFQEFLYNNIRCFDTTQNQPPNDYVTAFKSTIYSFGKTMFYVKEIYGGLYSGGNKSSMVRAGIYGAGQIKGLDSIAGLGLAFQFNADLLSIPSSFAGVGNAVGSARKLSVDLSTISSKAAHIFRGFTVAELGLNMWGVYNSIKKLQQDWQGFGDTDYAKIGRDVLGAGEYAANTVAGVEILKSVVRPAYFLEHGAANVQRLVRAAAWMRVGAVGLKYGFGPTGIIMTTFDMMQNADQYNVPDNLKKSEQKIRAENIGKQEEQDFKRSGG